jgi:hypothetical protein
VNRSAVAAAAFAEAKILVWHLRAIKKQTLSDFS